jgi:hypothetical protein
MRSIGAILAQLHGTGIIHGDLTTSNMMLRLTPNSPSGKPYEIVSYYCPSLIQAYMTGFNRFRTLLPSPICRELRGRSLRPREGFRIHSPSFGGITCGGKLPDPEVYKADNRLLRLMERDWGRRNGNLLKLN